MRICGVPCDFDGSGLYRVGFPFAALNELGWTCKLPLHERPLESYKGRNADMPGELHVVWVNLHRDIPRTEADVVVFQRPVEQEYVDIIRHVKALGMRVVVETDDWIAHPPSWNPSLRALNAGHNKERNVRVFAECAKLADTVTCSTPFLADGYRRYNRNIRVVRNYLERSMWERQTPVYQWRSWDRLRVGYMGDAKWHAGDLRELAGVIGPWLDRHPEVDFALTEEEGDEVSGFDLLGVPEDRRVYLPRVPFRSFRLPDITARFDIGLVPLGEHPFNEGKSHLKGLEYAACGIPCIASPTESYRWWVEPGVNGFLARRAREWTRALDALLDEAVRHRMGAAAREKAMLNTVDRHVDEWRAVYEDTVAGRIAA